MRLSTLKLPEDDLQVYFRKGSCKTCTIFDGKSSSSSVTFISKVCPMVLVPFLVQTASPIPMDSLGRGYYIVRSMRQTFS